MGTTIYDDDCWMRYPTFEGPCQIVTSSCTTCFCSPQALSHLSSIGTTIQTCAQPPQRQKGSNTCSASTTFCHNNSAELPCDFTVSMYIFNMSCPHWPVVQGLESTLVDNIQTECVQQQKAPTAAARQHGSGALPYQGHLQATAVNNRQRA